MIIKIFSDKFVMINEKIAYDIDVNFHELIDM